MLWLEQEGRHALPDLFRRLLETVEDEVVCQGHLSRQLVNLLDFGSSQLNELLSVECKGFVDGAIHQHVVCTLHDAASCYETSAC